MTNFRMLFCLAAFATGCSANFPQSPTPAPTLASIEIHYGSQHVAINPRSQQSLALYAIDSDGVYSRVTGAEWFSTNTAVVTVVNGTATGVSNGTADVVANYRGLSATARIVVGPLPNLRLDFAGSPSVGKLQLRARTGSGTGTRDVTDQVTWVSSDQSIASVDRGLLTATFPGTVAISIGLANETTTTYMSIRPIEFR